MAGEIVRIDIRGAADVAAALGKVERRLRSDFLRELKKTLLPVVPIVQSNIRSEGLVDSGKELGSVRPFFRGGGATMGIVVGAMNHGYNYPGRYEGDRPVLNPAWDESRPRIINEIERFLDRIVSEAGLGGKSGL